MSPWTNGMARRGLVTALVCIAIGVGGTTFAQNAAPIPAPSTPSSLPAPNVTVAPPAISVTPAPNSAPPPGQAAPPLLTQAQLEQLVAPIALYPDPLLAQILMASTYPLEVVEAARWVSAPANRGLTGEVMTTALRAQNWDPSIKALVPFPRVLENMSNQLERTEALGNAFLAQQAELMAAVQSLRQQAMAAGNLKQTPQCRCSIHASGNVISILPAEQQVVCVPVYSPAVYGPWPYPAYPPYYFPVPAGFAYAPGIWIGFGPPIELTVFGSFWGWGWVDWGHRDIAVDPGRYALASDGRPFFSGNVWVHDPAHRGGVAYADPVTRSRFDAARVSALAMSARGGAGRGIAAARVGDTSRFATARGEVAHGGADRFGAVAPVHGGAVAHRQEGGVHGAPAVHGGGAFRGRAEFHGAPTAHGGGAAFHAGSAAFNGRTGSHGGGSRNGGASHFARSGPHGAEEPHGGGGPHGGGSHGGGPHGGSAHKGGAGDHHG
jgi:hypothetical protein